MNLAEKIIYQRRKAGLSQEQLADRMGITRQAVSKWESGATVPEISKLVAISELFGVSVDYLVKDRIEVEEAADQKSIESLEEKVDNLASYMKGWQYTSKTKIKGIPLVSIRFSRQFGKDGVAKGIIAIGNVAVGVIAFGAISVGVISFGALAAGLLAIGAGALGILSWGAMAIGVFAFGSGAFGVYSVGVAAYGREIAVGVSAAGETVVGESVRGTNCLTWYQGITAEEIRAFLAEHNPNLWVPLRDVLAVLGEHIH